MQKHYSTDSIATYRDAWGIIQNLPPSDALRLAVEILTKLQSETAPTVKGRSLSELRGLGKEIWQQVDVDDYIQQERRAWDG